MQSTGATKAIILITVCFTLSEEAQLVVPEHEWANVLAAYHDNPLVGHYSAKKTHARIAKRYFWRGMRRYIESYIKNCLAW